MDDVRGPPSPVHRSPLPHTHTSYFRTTSSANDANRPPRFPSNILALFSSILFFRHIPSSVDQANREETCTSPPPLKRPSSDRFLGGTRGTTSARRVAPTTRRLGREGGGGEDDDVDIDIVDVDVVDVVPHAIRGATVAHGRTPSTRRPAGDSDDVEMDVDERI
jgi:hypothetical protein